MPTDRTEEMRRRLLRHMATVALGVVAALLVGALLGGIAVAVDATPSVRRALGIATAFTAVATVLGVGWASTNRNLRCPACNASVWWIASMNASAFAHRAPKQCPSCGVQLFAANRNKRAVIVLAIVAAACMAAGAAMSMLSRH